MKLLRMVHMYRIVTTLLLIPLSKALAIQPALQIANDPSLSIWQAALVTTVANSVPTQPSIASLPNATYNLTAALSGDKKLSACNVVLYGVPEIPSCLDVYKQMSDDDNLADFQDRSRGYSEYPLPYRWTSGEFFYLDTRRSP